MSSPLEQLRASNKAIEFDANNKKHREAFAFFVHHKKWPDGVRFTSEWPCTSVVSTVQDKLMRFAIRTELKQFEAVAA